MHYFTNTNPPRRCLSPRVFHACLSIRCGRYLHHNFVCALLNDLFGVQARAGCACAGPYGFILLGMDDRNTPSILEQLKANMDIIRPGFCRFSLTFFNSEEEVTSNSTKLGILVHFEDRHAMLFSV